MASDWDNGIREDRIRQRQDDEYLDSLFETPKEIDPDFLYDQKRQREIDDE